MGMRHGGRRAQAVVADRGRATLREAINAGLADLDRRGGRRAASRTSTAWHAASRAKPSSLARCFIRLRPRFPQDGLSVPLQLQMLPSEQLPLSKIEQAPNGNPIRLGVEFDQQPARQTGRLLVLSRQPERCDALLHRRALDAVSLSACRPRRSSTSSIRSRPGRCAGTPATPPRSIKLFQHGRV